MFKAKLKEAIICFSNPRVTLPYPFGPGSPVAEGFRGKLDIDETKCVGCGGCANVCPSRLIRFYDDGTTTRMQFVLDRCTYCGRCAEVCRYHAIAVVGQQVLVFREMCHGCGSCALNCPTQAIREVVNHFGSIELGHAGEIAFGQGILDVGQPLAPPIIRQLKRQALTPARREGVVIIDASPGTSCPVVESLRGADVALLVTEPTPFGLHDLRLAVEVARDELGLPVGVVINRAAVRGAAVRGADAGDDGVERFCAEQGVPVWLRIPLDRRIAEAYSEGLPLVRALPRYKDQFLEMYQQMMKHLAASRVLRGVP